MEPQTSLAPPASPLPTPKTMTIYWDIGWAMLIVGAVLLCAIYLIAVDSHFRPTDTWSGAYTAGYFATGLLLIPVGILTASPIWLIASLFKRPQRVSFKPFVLLGMATFILLGAAGKRYVGLVYADHQDADADNPATIDSAMKRAMDRIDFGPAQPTVTNSLVAAYRAQHPTDPRTDGELTMIFGAQNEQDARYKYYSDFVKDYESIKAPRQLAKQRAINLARHAKTWNESQENEQFIHDSLTKMTGDLKIVGWDATDYGDGTYLVRYNFFKGSDPKAWHLEVNVRAQIVRDVTKDESLRKKYDVEPVP
jgi:hypothetical protein